IWSTRKRYRRNCRKSDIGTNAKIFQRLKKRKMPAFRKQNIFPFFIFFSAPSLLPPPSVVQASHSFWQSLPASDGADPTQKSVRQSSGACSADYSYAHQSCYNSVLLSFLRSA